ncbi:unnamed protein product, partial [Discosporangium mesarthrocarpum]
MSARVPVGASNRSGLFGGSARGRDLGPPVETARRQSDGVPTAVTQQGYAATPYGSTSPGQRRPYPSPYNGNPITPGRAEYGNTGRSKESNMSTPSSANSRGQMGSQSDRRKPQAFEGIEDMLELEHVIGYTGHFLQTALAHPLDNDVIIKSVGALLVIANVIDPHQQQLLRGHDMEISALAISRSGLLMATGQCGSVHVKGFPAPAIVWDYATKKSLFVLEGISEGICHLSFSPDQRFLLGCGLDCLVYVWDTSTGEVISGKKFAKPATLAQWGVVDESGRRPVYHVCLCISKEILALELGFDPVRRQWHLVGKMASPAFPPMAMPSSGLNRHYHSLALGATEQMLVCGTDVGDMVVFSVDHKIYRASIPVCSGGLLSICADPATGMVICGAGDGFVRKVSGSDMAWQMMAETRLDGGVVSLSVRADNTEVLAGTKEGSIYRVLIDDLSATKVSSSQKAPVRALACGSRADVFATCSGDGIMRVWDLDDYQVAVEAIEAKGRVGALCVCWAGEDAVVTGWGDCCVRCYDATNGRLQWKISNAHRAPVACVASHVGDSVAYLVTGSNDGVVSVWTLRTRQLMLHFKEHQKGVCAVLVDVVSPNLIHSAGEDCTVLTYDLQKERRTAAHMTRSGAFQGMTQRLDSENELITCDVNGRLLSWDCDYREPVQVLQDPSQQRLSCVSVSPSGRYMAVGGNDQMVKVLDLSNGFETLACGRAHVGPVTGLQWTRDERQLISAAEDCTLAVWNFYGSPPLP